MADFQKQLSIPLAKLFMQYYWFIKNITQLNFPFSHILLVEKISRK